MSRTQFQVTYNEIEVPDKHGVTKAWRASIQFAPGPYGTVLTDLYMGKGGAEKAVALFLDTLQNLGLDVERTT